LKYLIWSPDKKRVNKRDILRGERRGDGSTHSALGVEYNAAAAQRKAAIQALLWNNKIGD
jgi:hypothetical protein